jgi:hypothetical protein
MPATKSQSALRHVLRAGSPTRRPAPLLAGEQLGSVRLVAHVAGQHEHFLLREALRLAGQAVDQAGAT